MALQVGESVGPYTIEQQLGAGGMATVYKAHHSKLDRYVAIKVLHTALLQDPNFHQRFEREARIVARLDHPNIVTVYDFSEHQNQPYLVMRYVEGRTLKHVLNDRSGTPLPTDEILRILKPIATALTYAHEHGVLHRDVKPSNIIIDSRGTPYLTDFGLARMAQAGESTMSADVMIGTPFYISPEQASGQRELTAATDIYSLGVVLYELVVGQVPFSADTPYATVHDHIYTAPPRPSEINAAVSTAVENVLLKALAKTPAERYSSAVEMLQAFEEALGNTGDQPAPMRAAKPVESPKPAEAARRVQVPAPHATPGSHQLTKPSQPPQPPQPPRKPEEFFEGLGQRAEKWGEQFSPWVGEIAGEIGSAIEESVNSEKEKRGRHAKRRQRRNRKQWRTGAKWVENGPEGEGYYTDQELIDWEKIESGVNDDEEAKIRLRIKKRLEERQGLIVHTTAFVLINLMLWMIWLFSSIGEGQPGLPWPMFVTGGWGIGWVAHLMGYWAQYGGGRERREAYIQREIEKERERMGYPSRKLKNEEFYHAASDRIRLTEDGELTDSFVDELNDQPNDQANRKRG